MCSLHLTRKWKAINRTKRNFGNRYELICKKAQENLNAKRSLKGFNENSQKKKKKCCTCIGGGHGSAKMSPIFLTMTFDDLVIPCSKTHNSSKIFSKR